MEQLSKNQRSFQWIDTKLLPHVLTVDQKGSQPGLAQIKYKVQMHKNSSNWHHWKISIPIDAVSLFLTIPQSPFHAFRTFRLFASLIQVWQVKQLDVYDRRDGVFPTQQGYTINWSLLAAERPTGVLHTVQIIFHKPSHQAEKTVSEVL